MQMAHATRESVLQLIAQKDKIEDDLRELFDVLKKVSFPSVLFCKTLSSSLLLFRTIQTWINLLWIVKVIREQTLMCIKFVW